MVENPVIVASFTAGIVALVSGFAESLHLKRVARVEKLIEGSDLPNRFRENFTGTQSDVARIV